MKKLKLFFTTLFALSIVSLVSLFACTGCSDKDYKISFTGGTYITGLNGANFTFEVVSGVGNPESFDELGTTVSYSTNSNQLTDYMTRWDSQKNVEITNKKNHEFYWLAKITNTNPSGGNSAKVNLMGREWGDNGKVDLEDAFHNDWDVDVYYVKDYNTFPWAEVNSSDGYEILLEPQATATILVNIEIEDIDKTNTNWETESFYVHYYVENIENPTVIQQSKSYLSRDWKSVVTDYDKVETISFVNDEYLNTRDLTGYNNPIRVGAANDSDGLTTEFWEQWNKDHDTNLFPLAPAGQVGLKDVFAYYNPTTKDLMFSSICKIYAEDNGTGGSIRLNYFAGCKNLKTINFNDFDTSQIRYFDSWFSGCNSLETVDLKKLDFSQTTSFTELFARAKVKNVSFAGVNTSHITDFRFMFKDATVDYLDVSNLNTSNGKHFEGMFANYSSSASILNLSNMVVTNAVDNGSREEYAFVEMFMGANMPNAYVTLPNLGSGKSDNICRMFREGTFKTLDLSKIVLGSKIAHYDELFLGATIGSLSLSGWDIPTRDEMEGIATLTFSNMFKCAAGGTDVTGEVFETALTAHITTLICPTSVGGATIQLPHNMYTDSNVLETTLQEGGLILNDKITQKPGSGGGGFFPEIVG